VTTSAIDFKQASPTFTDASPWPFAALRRDVCEG